MVFDDEPIGILRRKILPLVDFDLWPNDLTM